MIRSRAASLTRWRTVPLALLLAGLICGLAPVAKALDVRATVADVTAAGQVRMVLPSGAAVEPGDPVRIEADIPGIGPLAIETRWQVVESGPGYAVADPDGRPSGMPQAGYAAVIETSVPQTAAAPPEAAPEPASAAECDRLAAAPDDASALSPGVHSDELQRNADAAVEACLQAVAEAPSLPRLRLQLARALAARAEFAEAERWMRSAAEDGSVPAMVRLGIMLCSGCDFAPSIRKDDAEAVRWFIRAADQGHYLAMRNLGNAYRAGRGVARDPEQALRWYERAAELGDAPSITNLGVIYGEGNLVEKDLARAVQLFQHAADLGDTSAMYNLAMMHRHGVGLPRDERAATELFIEAADEGDAQAAYEAARALDRGVGTQRDPEGAAVYVLEAVRGGLAEALTSMVSGPKTWSAACRRAVQQELRAAGLYQGAIDGAFGSGTRRAIEALVAGQ